MKFLKTFEDLQSEEPEIGDYVLVKTNSSDDNIRQFINNNIGKLIRIDTNRGLVFDVKIQYYNPPSIIERWFMRGTYGEFFRIFRITQIVEFAKTKEELKMKINANKYNL